jgi:deoxyribodipyrimidine photo-lyase
MTTQKKFDCPSTRVRTLNTCPVKSDGSYVLYWMNAARRVHMNFALDRALQLAKDLQRPLIVLEALRCDYPWASDRFHQFAMQGMADNLAAFRNTDVHYYPYVERAVGHGKGLLRSLAENASTVVTDDCRATFFPEMLKAGAEQVQVRMEAVDSNGLLPLQATSKAYRRAHDFRRFLQHELKGHLAEFPASNPSSGLDLRRLRGLPSSITKRWPVAPEKYLSTPSRVLGSLPIDHGVGGTLVRGGSHSATLFLDDFVVDPNGLANYGKGRNHPDDFCASGLSPFLHFGHISPHEVLRAVAQRECWTAERIGSIRNGARSGWWGMCEETESFLDQLVTWRELGLNFVANRDDIQSYDSLPEWAQATLAKHATDTRPYTYNKAEFDAATTHDPLWNAAQTELKESGRMHNYMRMLWGKKILHWSRTPQIAFSTMQELNDKYALDGRDPNSYTAISWVFGRYDRAWGPERSVFGKVRYLSSKNTRSKLRLRSYLARWGGHAAYDPVSPD